MFSFKIMSLCLWLWFLVVGGAMSRTVYPTAEMDLKLHFDLSSNEDDNCFLFTPNAPFQGGSVSRKLLDVDMLEVVLTLRFYTESASANTSCLRIGGGIVNKMGVEDRKCAAIRQMDWKWESVPGEDGPLSYAVHSIMTSDMVNFDVGMKLWEVCVSNQGGTTHESLHENGVVTLFQRIESLVAETSELEMRVSQPSSYIDLRQSTTSLTGVTPTRNLASVYSTTITSNLTFFILVDSLEDSTVSTPSLCDPYFYLPATDTASNSGNCTLRAAVLACEALLLSDFPPSRCSVHLPAFSRVWLEPSHGSLFLSNASMAGTLAIVGNGCHISPIKASISDIRFLDILLFSDSSKLFAIQLSNMTLDRFGNASLNGGAVSLRGVSNTNLTSLIQDVEFVNNTGHFGGALYVSECPGLVVTSCTFISNFAGDEGGGVYFDIESSQSSFMFCDFINNTAYRHGGGLGVKSGNNFLSLVFCNFNGNSASYATGGGFHVESNNHFINLTACSFSSNSASNIGGGGMNVDFNNDNMIFNSCTFVENSAYFWGGGLRIGTDNNNTVFNGCTFSRNMGAFGGGLFVQDNNYNMSFIATNFVENSAGSQGGGFYFNKANNDLLFFRCLFDGNKAQATGGGGYVLHQHENIALTMSSFENNYADVNGGGMHLSTYNIRTTIDNCDFLNNSAPESGGGLSLYSSNTYMSINFCTFIGNSAQEGGGLYLNSFNDFMTISSCVWRRNFNVVEISGHGGGVKMNTENRYAVIRDSLFENNHGSYGGALYIGTLNEFLLISSSNLTLNGARADGAGICVEQFNYYVSFDKLFFNENAAGLRGGGLSVSLYNHYLRMTNCQFTDNIAGESGGGVEVNGLNYDVAIDQCTFEGNSAAEEGGSMMVSNSADLMTLSDCKFNGNIAAIGGAVYAGDNNINVNFTFCLFSGNIALVKAGAIFVGSNNDDMSLIDCIFQDNVSPSVGGIFVDNNNIDMSLVACAFKNNTSQKDGGGMFVGTRNDNLELRYCFFTNNSAADGGGGLCLNTNNVDVSLLSCSFSQNEASEGAGMYVISDNTGLTVNSSLFLRNDAMSDGGGLHFRSFNHHSTITSCHFLQNSAFEYGAGLYIGSDNYNIKVYYCDFEDNVAEGYGGGAFVGSNNENCNCSHCLFTNNTAGVYGGGVYVGNGNFALLMNVVSFLSNKAEIDGGALSLLFDNFRVCVQGSLFQSNEANVGGGAIHSALRNSFLVLRNNDFVDNTAPLVGGSVYIGENHESVLLESSSIIGSFADSGGGLFISRFCSDITLSSCTIVANSARSGGGLVSVAKSLIIRNSVVEGNTASLMAGGIQIEDANLYFRIFSSNISGNVVGGSSGGMRIADSANVIIESCQFLNNTVREGPGGALTIGASSPVNFKSSTFASNYAHGLGGAVLVYSSSDVRFLKTQWLGNQAGDSGGGLHISISRAVTVVECQFKFNGAMSGYGSAIYARVSDAIFTRNEFKFNRAAGAGTVFWEHASGMMEPSGLKETNFFATTNDAAYGTRWATEAHHARTKNNQTAYPLMDYTDFAPTVGLELQDLYDQVVVTDSTSLAAVFVPTPAEATCYNAIGIVAGTTTVTFTKGTTEFTQLEPLCAPNHSLGLSVEISLSSVSKETSFVYDFRACNIGEYFGEFICNPCEEGTYSFSDPTDYALSELTQTAVCQPCPSGASFCKKDTIVLFPGYWRSDMLSTNIMDCPWHIESCRGGSSAGDASCGQGYHGPLCAVCDVGYHFVSSSRTCESCKDKSSFFDPFTVVLMVLAIVCLLIFFIVLKKFIRKEGVTSVDGFVALALLRVYYFDRDDYDKEKSDEFPLTHSLRLRASKSFAVYITFYQIVSSLPFILDDVDFPNVFDKILSAVSVVNLFISQETIVTCTTSSQYDYVTKLVVGTTVPIVIAVLLGVSCVAHLHFSRKGNPECDKLRSIAANYKKAALILSFLVLPSVSVMIFQTFSCHDVGSSYDQESSFMTADYSVSCSSSRYKFVFWWAFLMIFVYPIGIPLTYLGILLSSRRNTTELEGGASAMLCQDYASQYWHWEVVDTIFRVSVTGFLVLLYSTTDTIVAGMLLTFVYLKLVQMLQPFSDKPLNNIKETSLWQIFFVFFIALLIKMNDMNSKFLTASLIVAFFANFILLGGQCLVGALTYKTKPMLGWYDMRSDRSNENPRPTDVEMSSIDAVASLSIKNSCVGVGVTDDGSASSMQTQQSPLHVN